MFGKLLKYEFKAAGKLYGVLFLILAIVSSIFGLMLSNSISSGITSDDAVSAVYSFFTIVFFSTCTALVISNLVITIRRFYQNIFGREAYLTWTLPANAHQIILSKMTMATIWYIASVLGIFLSIIWMAFLVALGSGVDVLNKIGLLLSYIPLIPTLQIAFYLLLGSISFVLFLYLSISIGQLFQNHRILMSFVAAFVLWIIIGVLNRQLYFTNPFIYAITYAQYVGSYSQPPIQFSFLSAYTYEIIKLLLFYFGVYYITQIGRAHV